jgi:hypothetical protein
LRRLGSALGSIFLISKNLSWTGVIDVKLLAGLNTELLQLIERRTILRGGWILLHHSCEPSEEHARVLAMFSS